MRQAGGARGITHIHTEFSFDGTLGLAALAEKCRRRGLAFAALSDHAESMNETLLERMVEECRECSDSDFVLIPGLEHRYKRGIHILALGQNKWIAGESLDEMLMELADDGCVLVASHCVSPADLPPELLEILTAVEIWNVSRDTRLLPTATQVRVYKKWAESYAHLYAIGGLDMHKGAEWGCEVVLESSGAPTPAEVLRHLTKGRFSTRSRLFCFGSRPAAGVPDVAFAIGNALASVRRLRDRVMK